VALVLLINLQDGPESGSHLRRLTGVLLSAVVLLDYFSIFLAIGDHPKVGVTVLSKAASLPILWGLVSLRLSRYETGVLAAMARRTLDVLRFVMGLAVFALFSWAVDLKASGQEPLARMIAVFYGPLVSTVQTLIGLKPWSGATKDGTGTALLLCAFGYAGLGWMNLEMVDVWWASGLFGMIASHVGSVATLYYTGRRA
jgi:hypothetical protein